MINLNDVLTKEASSILKIPRTNDYQLIVGLIFDRIVLGKNNVIVTGIGKSGIAANYLVSILNSIGIKSIFLHPTEAKHGLSGVIDLNDIVIAISNSGESIEVLEVVTLLQNIAKGISIVSITKNRENSLYKKAGFSLISGETEEIDPLKIVPTTSFITACIVCQLLLCELMDALDITKKQYITRHPSNQNSYL